MSVEAMCEACVKRTVLLCLCYWLTDWLERCYGAQCYEKHRVQAPKPELETQTNPLSCMCEWEMFLQLTTFGKKRCAACVLQKWQGSGVDNDRRGDGQRRMGAVFTTTLVKFCHYTDVQLPWPLLWGWWMRSFVYLYRSFVFVPTRLCLSALPLLCVFSLYDGWRGTGVWGLSFYIYVSLTCFEMTSCGNKCL